MQKCKKGRGLLRAQRFNWALKREGPSHHSEPRALGPLYFSTSEGQHPSSRVSESVKSMLMSPVWGWNSTV